MPAKNDKKSIHFRIGKKNNVSPITNEFTLNNICLGGNNYVNIINGDTSAPPTVGSDLIQDENLYDEFFKNQVNRKHITRRTRIPYLKVYEFEPDMMFKFSQHLEVIYQTVTTAFDALGKALEKPAKLIIDWTLGRGPNVDIEDEAVIDNKKVRADEAATFKILANLFIDSDEYEEQVITKPMAKYRSFFNGQYINSYELPYTDDAYMTVNGSSGWKTISAKDIDLHNNVLNTLWKMVSNLGIVDTLPVPVWKRDAGGDAEYSSIRTEFHLNNKDLKSLIENFHFLVTLVQGPLWVQYNTRFVPPNIYTVELPGVINLQYATMTVDVIGVGNKRKIPIQGSRNWTTALDIKHMDEFMERQYNLDDSAFYPDAWKVTISFKSLVPNNFNNYLSYLMNGSSNVNVGTVVKGSTDLVDKWLGTEKEKK